MSTATNADRRSITFEDRGDYMLKGVPGSWHLCTVS